MKYLLLTSLLVFGISCQKDSSVSDVSGESKSGFKVQERNSAELYNLYPNYTPSENSKRPFLIYYAVDGKNGSDEPFMQNAVDYEIESLKNACRTGGRHVNWVVVRNSQVVNNQSFDFCWEGKLKEGKPLAHVIKQLNNILGRFDNEALVNPKCGAFNKISLGNEFEQFLGKELALCGPSGSEFYPHGRKDVTDLIKQARLSVGEPLGVMEQVCEKTETNLRLAKLNQLCQDEKIVSEAKIEVICKNKDSFAENATSLIKTVCDSKIDFVQAYKDFPLIHPEFLSAVVNNKILYPFANDVFVPVFHIKSHGHHDFALTGLLPHQRALKSLNQQKELSSQASIFKNPVPNFQQAVDQVFMSNSYLSQFSQKASFSLSQDTQCGLKAASSAFLGVNSIDSLGAGSIYKGNQPGIVPETFLEVLAGNISNEVDQYDDISGKNSLFVYLEACDAKVDSNRWMILSDSIKQKVGGLYSAQGSLLFRNLDWDILFHSLANIPETHQARAMQELMKGVTSNITYTYFSDQSKDVSSYDKVIDKLIELKDVAQ